MAESILREKSYTFSIQIVKLYQYLVLQKKESTLSKQILRSGTSIWALLREAEFGQSKADFINKMSIALKESNETLYRLDILHDTWYIEDATYNLLYSMGKELLKMLVSAIKTSKRAVGY